MWPTPVSARGTEAAVLTTPSVSNAWQLGTILKAMALSDSADGNVRLQIGARVVTAQTSLPLQSGQILRLQVAETGRNVVLRSVGDAPHGEPIRAGIRENLPRQMPQTPLLAAALNLAKSSAPLPAELAVAVARLTNATRDAATLTETQGLRMAVRDSGNFLENRLVTALNTADRPAAALPRDWKAALLRFRDQLAQLQVRLAGAAGAKQPARLATSASTGNALTSVTQSGSPGPSTASVNPTRAQPATASPITLAATTAGPATADAAKLVSVAAMGAAKIAHLATVGAASAAIDSPQSTTPTSIGHTQQSAPTNNIPPPMRHALPHPQPVIQQSTLPTDPLSLIGELINNTEGALSRVRLNQLASITPDQGSRLVWLLELPVRHPDNRAEVVTMRIEKDEEGGTQKESTWTADLAFDLGAKGELRARVALRAGRVSVSFWADADQTRTEVQGKLPQLKTAMEKKQLNVATLNAGAGQPTEPRALPASLLETRA